MGENGIEQLTAYVAPTYYVEEEKSFAENQVANVYNQSFGEQYDETNNLNKQQDKQHSEVTRAYIEEKYEAMKQQELAKIDAKLLITRNSRQKKKQKVEKKFADSSFREQALATIKAPFGSDDAGRAAKAEKLRDSTYIAEQSHLRDMDIAAGTIQGHPKEQELLGNNDFIATLRTGDSDEVAIKNREMANKMTSGEKQEKEEYTVDLCQRVVGLDLSVLQYKNIDEQIAKQKELEKLFQFGLSSSALLSKVASPTDTAGLKLLAKAKVVAEYICKMSTVNKLSNDLEVRGIQSYSDDKTKKEIGKRASMGGNIKMLKEYSKLGLVAGKPDYNQYINKSTDIDEQLEKLNHGGIANKISYDLAAYGIEAVERTIKKQFLDKDSQSDGSIKAMSSIVLDKIDLLPKKLVEQFIVKYRTNKAFDYKLAQSVAQSRRLATQQVTGMSYMEKHSGGGYNRTFGQWARPVEVDENGKATTKEFEENKQYNINMSNAFRDREKAPEGLTPYINDFVQKALAVQIDEDMFSMKNFKKNLPKLRESLQIATNVSDFLTHGYGKHVTPEQLEKLKKISDVASLMLTALSSRVASMGIDITTYAVTGKQAWETSVYNNPEAMPDFTVDGSEKVFKQKLNQLNSK